MAVYPGDVVRGEANNVTIIPAHLAGLVEACEAQDGQKQCIAARAQAGAAL